jgi:hypothetical protein
MGLTIKKRVCTRHEARLTRYKRPTSPKQSARKPGYFSVPCRHWVSWVVTLLEVVGRCTVCLSEELTRPLSRDVMLNAVLKTLPLTITAATAGAMCTRVCYR